MVGTSKEVTREERELQAFKAAQFADALRETAATEGWAKLKESFAQQRAKYFGRLATHLMQGRVIDQRKLDYNRGFFDGVQQLLEQPEKADAHLAALVKKLEATTGERE